MKHSFFGLFTFAAVFVFVLAACSKNEKIKKEEPSNALIIKPATAKSDTPYGKSVTLPVMEPVEHMPSEIIIMPAAQSDTPYGKQ